MRQFYNAYSERESGLFEFGQLLPGQFKDYFFSISFTHHILLLNKCKTREVVSLERHIKSNLYATLGKLPNNFNTILPEPVKTRALEIFKDNYLLDFLTDEDEDEGMLESEIVSNIKKFVMQLGTGFSFIGNQYPLKVDGEEYFVDLLFYNRLLQCLAAIELKRGKFKPGYAGQLNFYLNLLDNKVRLPHENMSIGIILCKEKSNTVVEYSFRNMNKPMGVSTYSKDHNLTKDLPEDLKDILPAPGSAA